MATITVEDVLWLALPAASTVLVDYNLGRAVTGSILVRSTSPALPNLRDGQLVLISPAVLAALDERLDLRRFVERLSGAPIAGLAVLGAVEQAAQAVAAQAAFPLVSLPAEANLRDVQREIQRLINDGEAQIDRRAAQLFTALTREALDSSGIPTVLEILQRWTGRTARYLPGPQSRPGAAPVVVGGRQAGALQIEGAHRWVRVAAEQGALALALLLDKERAVQTTEARIRGELVDVLVSGLPFEVDALTRRAAELGYELSRSHAILLLQAEDQLAPERLEAALRRELERSGVRAPLGRRGDMVLCLYPPLDAERAEEELQAVFQRLRDAGFSCSGGLSSPAPLAAWPERAAAAEQSLLLGRRVFGAGQLVASGALGIYRLLLLLYDQQQLQDYYAQTIGLLVDYEGRSDGELLQTLAAFYAELGNHTRTARLLHIHRNTLLYRLRRIEQITGCDLASEEDRLALQIGLRVHRIAQSRQCWG